MYRWGMVPFRYGRWAGRYWGFDDTAGSFDLEPSTGSISTTGPLKFHLLNLALLFISCISHHVPSACLVRTLILNRIWTGCIASVRSQFQ